MLMLHFKRISIRTVANMLVIIAIAMFAGSSQLWGQDYDNPDAAAGAQEPIYPGIPPQGKAETTVGSQKLRIYGTFLMNASGSDSVEVGQDLVLWPLPGGNVTFADGTTKPNSKVHDLIFTAR